MPLFVPDEYKVSLPTEDLIFRRCYINKGLLSKIFIFLEHPNICFLSRLFQQIVIYVNALVVVAYILSTIPDLQYVPETCTRPMCDKNPNLYPNQIICEPVASNVFSKIDIICAYFFSIELATRLLLCATVQPRVAGVVSSTEVL